MATDDFLLIAGEAGEGAHFTFGPDFRLRPEAATVVAAFRDTDSFEPAGYPCRVMRPSRRGQGCATKPDRWSSAGVIRALHSGAFDTVIGKIGFDKKGDVTGISPFIWYASGKKTFAPVSGVGQ